MISSVPLKCPGTRPGSQPLGSQDDLFRIVGFTNVWVTVLDDSPSAFLHDQGQGYSKSFWHSYSP